MLLSVRHNLVEKRQRPVDIEKRVLSQRGRARRDIETRMAIGRGKVIAQIAKGEVTVPNIEVKIHDGEWLVGIINPEDLSYIERDGSQMTPRHGQKTLCMPAPRGHGMRSRPDLATEGRGHVWSHQPRR